MSLTENGRPRAEGRPLLWWRLVAACTGLYLLLLAANYVVPGLTGHTVVWVGAEIVLVAFAVFAAAKDLAAAGPRRPLRRTERIVLTMVVVLVLVWLAGLALAWAASDDKTTVLTLLIGLIVTIPVIPITALTLPGTIVFRRIPR
jgi:hypothetical protein